MALFYPETRPTSVRLKLPKHPVSFNMWLGIAEYPQILGSLPVDAELALDYRLLQDIEASKFLRLWYRTNCGFFAFESPLPDSIGLGIEDSTLKQQILNPSGLKWTFKSKPEGENVFAGRTRLSVTLIAELR